ncbi:MAG: DUF3556 domain-containing protein [Bacteroidota bacterium]
MLKLFSPPPFPFDYDEWKALPFGERVNKLCQVWALRGYGAPVAIYSFYVLKIGLYVLGWLVFCSHTHTLGAVSDIDHWWFKPEALQKAILWSILFEVLGFGSGSGPLTARYFPPFGAFLHFFRPGTIRRPMFQNMAVVGGDRRRWLEVFLYANLVFGLLWALMAPKLNFTHIYPILMLLPVLGILDRTIFLCARAEHYWIALLCFMFPEDALAGTKVVWWAVWFWAATSKLNRHFPSVIAVMVSNSAILRSKWLKKRLYRNFPEDLRPSKTATVMAHMGTIIEYLFPLILIFGHGGTMTTVGLIVMLVFHLFITLNVPMAVPIEWNVIMVYGGFVLFGHHAETWIFDIQSLPLIAMLFLMVGVIPIVGNLVPKWVSFLMSMRYYAGNWAYSVWLFKDGCNDKLDDHLVKSSKTVVKQLSTFYDENTSNALISMVIAFRSMHLHGRVLMELVPKAVDDIDAYTWRDGELIAGIALGWNFGDGHLHNEELLQAIQRRCNFEPGQLRCIFVQSQPFFRPHHDWRIVDACDGQIASGRTKIDDIIDLQPWKQV